MSIFLLSETFRISPYEPAGGDSIWQFKQVKYSTLNAAGIFFRQNTFPFCLRTVAIGLVVVNFERNVVPISPANQLELSRCSVLKKAK